jgi:hypothetical protein
MAGFRFQVAALLRTALRESFGVKLRTISRLVVLFHICVGVAEYDRSDAQRPRLINASSKRPLTVGGVDQKLREAGFPKLTLLDLDKLAATNSKAVAPKRGRKPALRVMSTTLRAAAGSGTGGDVGDRVKV